MILVDNSPSAMILPTSVFDMIEEANDYYFPTLTSVYLKISRTLINLMTIFLTPVFLHFYAESELAAESICLCGGEGYGEYSVDLSAPDAGSGN